MNPTYLSIIQFQQLTIHDELSPPPKLFLSRFINTILSINVSISISKASLRDLYK